MLRRGILLALLVAFISVSASIRPDHAPSFVAFSLRQAEREAVAGRAQSAEVAELAGMTDLIGWVYDSANKDHVLVGISRPGQQRLRLDHFVAALRAVIDHKQFPEVSIDPPGPGGTPGKQPVNFKGGIENTALGQAMYQADVQLKRLALGKVSGQVWNVPSYLQLAADFAQNTGKLSDVHSKFYFVGGTTAIDGGASLGVVTIHRLSARIQAEVVQGVKGESDSLGLQFASALSGSLPDLALEYPALASVAPIMKMVAIARVLDEAATAAPLTYWRQTYRLPVVPTLPTHDLEVTRQAVSGLSKEVVLQGGIATGTTLLDLRNGDSLAFREVVLKSRPNSQALSWSPPLDQWDIAGDVNYGAALDRVDTANQDDGFHLYGTLMDSPRSSAASTSSISSWPRDLPSLSNQSIQSTLATIPLPTPPPAVSTPHSPQWAGVGGVMLSDTATVRGAANTATGMLGTGKFSLILDDKAAVAEPMAFRRFVTALWAVYFGDTDPGISIDPISRGNSKQLVRYVGDVNNSDLGRVMRQADYLMKQWAVGASRPALSDFANPDDLAWKRRTLFLNAMSRFWFVPQDMTFKATSDALLFDSGRMTVKTEFLALNSRGLRADPANEDFAVYLTTNYQKLAGLHPVLRELEEYAKLVSLAKYLKQSGAPLYWFLLANKDLVLTEESPGTVDAIFRDSANFSGVKIEGGVELTSKENYVLDAAARQAIANASATLSTGALIKSTVQSQSTHFDATASFDLQNKKYSIVPQHSTSSGKDFRGIRYQTDVSVHLEGFALTKDKLADLLPAVKRQEVWDSLRPTVEKLSDNEAQTRFKQLYEEAETKASGRAESLIGKLSLQADKDYRDSRAIGQDVEYAIGKDDFDRFGALILKYAQYRSNLDVVRFFNPTDSSGVGEFGRGWHLMVPYRLGVHGSQRREFQNVSLPAEMEVTNVITGQTEVLTFSADRSDGVGYFPSSPTSALSSLLLHPDTSMRLTDKIGCRFEFDRSLRLTEMRYSPGHVVKVNYADSLFNAFDTEPYEVDPSPSDQERVDFRGVSILKRLTVKDMYGHSETLTFGGKNNIVGYVPEDQEKSRYELLALLSGGGGGFQLRDKQGVEVRFSSGGHFEGVILPAGSRPISDFEMGRHRVVFRYSIDRSGHIVIDSAWVSPNEPGSKPLYVVSYKYDEAGSLARASLETPEGKPALALRGRPIAGFRHAVGLAEATKPVRAGTDTSAALAQERTRLRSRLEP
jgi:hypothetical protein